MTLRLSSNNDDKKQVLRLTIGNTQRLDKILNK